MIYIRMIRRKLENGGRFRTRNITFDRAGIDKLICHADSIQRVTMVATPSSLFSYFLRVIRTIREIRVRKNNLRIINGEFA